MRKPKERDLVLNVTPVIAALGGGGLNAGLKFFFIFTIGCSTPANRLLLLNSGFVNQWKWSWDNIQHI